MAPKLGPFLLGEESASKKKKEGELAESTRIPQLVRRESGLFYNSGAPGQ